jgi:hypothetical protein
MPVPRIKVKLSLCLTKHRNMKAYWGSGGVAPCILDVGPRRRWVVSFSHQPLYFQGKSPWYPLDRRLGGPQSRSGRGGEEKKVPISCRDANPRYPSSSSALFDWAIPAPELLYGCEWNLVWDVCSTSCHAIFNVISVYLTTIFQTHRFCSVDWYHYCE